MSYAGEGYSQGIHSDRVSFQPFTANASSHGVDMSGDSTLGGTPGDTTVVETTPTIPESVVSTRSTRTTNEPRWKVFDGEDVEHTISNPVPEKSISPQVSIQERVENNINMVKNSGLAIAFVTAVVVGIILVTIKPAFVLKQQTKTEKNGEIVSEYRISIPRIMMWIGGVFMAVALRDQAIHAYNVALLPVQKSICGMFGSILKVRN